MKRLAKSSSPVGSFVGALIVCGAAMGPFAVATASLASQMERIKQEEFFRRELTMNLAESSAQFAAGKALSVDGSVAKVDTTNRTDPLTGIVPAQARYITKERIQINDIEYFAAGRKLDSSTGLVAVIPTDAARIRVADYERRVWFQSLSAAVGVSTALAAVYAVKRSRGTLSVAVQQTLLTDAAHELRSPLAVIATTAGSALARRRSTEHYVSSLQEIRSAAERASSGVGQLLTLSSLDNGQVLPRLVPIRLDLVAEEAAALFTGDSERVDYEPGPAVVVKADLALLRQAIEGVIRNALARADRVHVVVGFTRTGNPYVDIRDNGPGFEAHHLDRPFQRHRRGDAKGSIGIGLSIVARVVDLHGGTTTLTNNDDGGANVRIVLPQAVPPVS
jgi:signal transduction histidine kinase